MVPPINEGRYSPPVPILDRKVRRNIDGPKEADPLVHHAIVQEQENLDILYLLLAFRCINALLSQTFFQPDEYYQSLEPAWQMAFGSESGAWLTWEWQHQLRSSLHPAIFAGCYFVFEHLMRSLSMYPQFRAMILVHMPKLIQGVLAAVGDFYTWKLAEKVYGRGNNYAWTTLVAAMFNPFHWFVCTRTLSNSLENVLTVAALYYWPWPLYGEALPATLVIGRAAPKPVVKVNWKFFGTSDIFQTTKDLRELRSCLFLAAFACLLRPTNLLIWLSIALVAFTRLGLSGGSKATWKDFLMVGREVLFCGTAALAVSIVSDRLYFGFWTFPPYQWLHFNISQDLAVFYGQNRPDYYFTEGLPLLLTTYLPFAIVGLVSATSISSRFAQRAANIRFQFAFTILVMVSTLSLISHKEVRFIYPLLPMLHIMLAPHISSFLDLGSIPAPPAGGLKNPAKPKLCIPHSWRRALVILLFASNFCLGIYVSMVHQRGVIDVMAFLRADYERLHLDDRGKRLSEDNETFAAFLMPCHSTPWRSHLVYKDLGAWALTCEPPLDIPAESVERQTYRDEADRFFDNPAEFLAEEFGSGTPTRPWPRYFVTFEGVEGLEDVLKNHVKEAMHGATLKRAWEGFNSHFHDDSRRKGRVVVWEMADAEKDLSSDLKNSRSFGKDPESKEL